MGLDLRDAHRSKRVVGQHLHLLSLQRVALATPATRVSAASDLSHAISDGMITYPGLPAATIATHLTREASRERYAPGYEFHIGAVSMVGNTGTYLDVPFHRFADGYDLADLDPGRVAGVPGVVVDGAEQGATTTAALDDSRTSPAGRC